MARLPVNSAFAWHDWRPFLVVGSRVGGVEEIAGGQGRLGEVAGFLRAASPQRAPLPHSVRPFPTACAHSGGFCFWREEVGQGDGERSHVALVLFLHWFSSLTAKATRTRSRIKARSAFQRLRVKCIPSRKPSSSSEALFRQCGLCGHGPFPPLFPFSRTAPFS